MPSPTRVLLVAADAMDQGIVRRLAAAGRLPVLSGLLDSAAVCELEADEGFFVGSTWATFASANRPERHSYYCWQELVGGTYDVAYTDALDGSIERWWGPLDAAGRSCCIIDVPHSVVQPELAATQIVEWGCHDRHLGPASHPADLLATLEASVGRHYGADDPPAFDNFAPCDYRHRAEWHRTGDEAVALWDTVRAGQAAKEGLSLELLDRGGWDLFVSVLGETHCTGHQLWHVHDRTHPRHDPALRARIGDPIESMYAALDATIGRHLDRVDADTAVYVMLSHGMGPHYDGTHLLDGVLAVLDANDRGRDHTGWRSRVARPLTAATGPRTRRAIAGAVRRRVASSPPMRLDERPLAPPHERRAFVIPNNTVTSAVRLNVRGREPHGCLEPGPEAAAFAADLTSWLHELVNVDTGAPAVVSVTPTDRVYRRAEEDNLPDLLVEWNRSAPVERLWSPRLGTVWLPYEHFRTGDHLRHGLLLAQGPGIRPGARAAKLRHEDIGPTLARALGVELHDVDGRPRADLLPTPAG